MEYNKARKVIEMVAQQHNVTPEIVTQEIQIAINEARKNADPNAQAMWNKIFPGNRAPTPEELIVVLSQYIFP